MYKWFGDRCIGARVVDHFGIHRVEKSGVGFLAFPYYWRGELVNHKYRSADKQFRQDKDAERTIYNIDACAGSDLIVWVEGECFPSDAEVLTPRGWISFESLDPSDKVAQWDDGKISFVAPLAHVRKRFTGNLIQFSGLGYMSRTTPNHSLVSRDRMGRLRKTKAAAFPASTSDVIPRCGVVSGDGIPLTDSQLIVALAVAADGTVDYRTGRSNHKPKEMRYCRMGFKKRRKIERILGALSDCEITPSVSENADTGYTTVCFSMPDWIPGKTFPVDWIAQATATQREFLLSELVQWDGNSVVNRNQTEFASKHESEASWVQALAHTSGICSTMMFRKNSYGSWWKVSILHGKQHTGAQHLNRSEVFYDGDVYCVTVPSGMLMVRQDRKITISGNCDVLALEECGIHNAVTLPDGAPSSVGGGDKRYAALGNCKTALAGKKYVLAGDMDIPGLAHREELARRLGKVNCLVVEWPEGCKDANQTLMEHGPDAVCEAILDAKPYPIEGLYEVDDYVAEVLDLYQNGRPKGLSTGWSAVDEFYTVKELDLCIVLGIPNMGKSSFMDALAVNMARLHDWKFAVCSFETMPHEHISTLVEKIAGLPFSDGFSPKMDPPTLRKSLEFANEHFVFIRGEEQQPTVDFILERAADAVLRHGIKGLIIDPYNEIEHARGDKNETEYVSDLLSRLRRFNRSHGVTTWLICHPTKMRRDENGIVPPPTLYDAMGSSHFNNKADSSFTVHRPDFNSPITEIYVRKIRHRWTGKPSPTPIKLRFIGLSGDYSDDLQGL
jgi:hypothetical protein